MHPPLRIEVPDDLNATTLRRELKPFGVEIIAVDGHYEVQVELIDRNPEQRVTSALNAIDAWLVTAGLPSIQLHLDGDTYTIHAPPAHGRNGSERMIDPPEDSSSSG